MTSYFGASIKYSVDFFLTRITHLEVLGCLRRKIFCGKIDCDSETVFLRHRLSVPTFSEESPLCLARCYKCRSYDLSPRVCSISLEKKHCGQMPTGKPSLLLLAAPSLPLIPLALEPNGSLQPPAKHGLPTPASQSGERQAGVQPPAQRLAPVCSSLICMNWEKFVSLILSFFPPELFKGNDVSFLSNFAGAS